MSPKQDDEDVGYGRAPKKTRWKKGQSGNPQRQYPARSKSTVELIDKFFLRSVEVALGGDPAGTDAQELCEAGSKGRRESGRYVAPASRPRTEVWRCRNQQI
jgi:hypothetical protein